MSGLALRGLWFRRSTALIVLVLATVASAAAVVAPLYARAAEESILRDTLRRSDSYSLAVHVAVSSARGGEGLEQRWNGRFTARLLDRTLTHPAFGTARLSYAATGAYAPTRGEFAGGEVTGQLVERAGVCRHLTVVTGRCPRAADEGLLTRRSAQLLGVRPGDVVPLTFEDSATLEKGDLPVARIRLVGLTDPVPVGSAYWVGQPYFASFYPDYHPDGLEEIPPSADPVFVGPGTSAGLGLVTYTVDVPVDPARVGLDDIAPLREQADRARVAAGRYLLGTETQLEAALARADTGRALVRVAAPLAVAQLVLLSWWTLYLVVGSATEERTPELGLAKLRGLTPRQTRRFGLAEVVVLLLAATPLGAVAGYLGVRAAAGRVFAPGTEVSVTPSVLLTALITLAGGIVTAALGSRQVFRRPVIELLRRVPARSGRRAGLVEAMVVVLAGASLVQLVADRGARPSPLALLAPGLLAVVGGLLAGRVLVRVARRRSARAQARGDAAALAGWAALSRRPGTARIASVVAVACCLLLVGVQAWVVAARNRHERAAAETGAAVVLQARAVDAAALLQAVRAADPSGAYAMAAVTVEGGGDRRRLLAVDATRADAVLQWGAPDAGPRGGAGAALRPALPRPLWLPGGTLSVTVELGDVDSPSPLSLSARVATQSGAMHRVELGRLSPGRRAYTAELPAGCATRCRLVAVGVSHPATDIGQATATLLLGPIAGVDAVFDSPVTWRPATATVGGPSVRVQRGERLTVELTAPGGLPAEVVHGDAPDPLPAVVAGADGADGLEAGGLTGQPVFVRALRSVPYLPGLGSGAVMVDLELALRAAERSGGGTQQIWLSRDDPRQERALTTALRRAGVTVSDRTTLAERERSYAGDGAVLALRLLLVCAAAAVLVSVGALLVAAYVGRRQRAYEVAALRAVGVRRRTVATMLVRENVGAVVVALACGAVAAWISTWVVLPSLPEFDVVAEAIPVRHSPEPSALWSTLAGLGAVLLVVGGVVAGLQLRAGRSDRLREGVR